MSYHRGIVAELGTGANLGKARVQFPQRDNITSHWIPFVVRNSQGTKDWDSPQVGAQVACLMDEHFEDGCIAGELWGATDAPPAGAAATNRITAFDDGTVVKYDLAAHAMSITLTSGGSATITQPAGAALTLDASGNVEITAAGTITATVPTFEIDGNLIVTGDIFDRNQADGSLHNFRDNIYNPHTHVDSHGDTSGPPAPQWSGG